AQRRDRRCRFGTADREKTAVERSPRLHVTARGSERARHSLTHKQGESPAEDGGVLMEKQRRWVHRWLFALVVAALGFSYAVVAVRADESLLSEARRERGTIRWYTALNVNGSKPLADAFEKKYPFLKVDITRLSNERIMNRIFAEAKSVAPQFDVTSFAYLPL